MSRRVWIAATLVAVSAAPAWAMPEKGEIVQTDTLGLNLYSHDYVAGTTKTVSDRVEPAEFIGLHYFFEKGWRFGVNLQFTERASPAPPANQSWFRTFAILPQVGWHFYDPFFAALVMTIAPFIDGVTNYTIGAQLVGGAGFAIAPRVKLNVALEVPINFVGKTTIGLTPLIGVSFRL